MRSFIIALCCIVGVAACSASNKPADAKSPVAASSNDAPKLGTCREGASTEEYGCAEGDMCPNLMDDVRGMTGFHVIGTFVDGGGRKRLHVADTCQHYFCGIDDECAKKGGPDAACIRPTGCLLVHKLKK